jgi:hypothetical protein
MVKVTRIQSKKKNKHKIKSENVNLEEDIPMLKCDDKGGFQSSTLWIHEECI